MKHTIYTFTRVNTYGDLMELEHFGREDNAIAAMEKSVQKKLNLLKKNGWDMDKNVSVENSPTGKLVTVYYGESHDNFQVTERTIEIETYIV